MRPTPPSRLAGHGSPASPALPNRIIIDMTGGVFNGLVLDDGCGDFGHRQR